MPSIHIILHCNQHSPLCKTYISDAPPQGTTCSSVYRVEGWSNTMLAIEALKVITSSFTTYTAALFTNGFQTPACNLTMQPGEQLAVQGWHSTGWPIKGDTLLKHPCRGGTLLAHLSGVALYCPPMQGWHSTDPPIIHGTLLAHLSGVAFYWHIHASMAHYWPIHSGVALYWPIHTGVALYWPTYQGWFSTGTPIMVGTLPAHLAGMPFYWPTQ